MRGVLLLAGVYNLAWGLFIYSFPEAFHQWLTAKAVAYAGKLVIYQGMGVFIFGMMYILTALYPLRFWYLILLGLLSKLLGAIGVYFFIIDKTVTKQFIFHLLVNDLVWLVPLAFITYRAFWFRKKQTYEEVA